MNQNSELLEYIYQNVEMGVSSTTALLKALNDKDNKIKPLVEEELKQYEHFLKESKNILKKHDVTLKDKGLMAKMMSTMGIKKEVKEDNSDAAIADMLIQGFTMGNLEIEKNIEKYQDKADKKIINIAKELAKFGTEEIQKLKTYI